MTGTAGKDQIVGWADRYLAVPRWIFATLYWLFAALGVTVIIISSPTINLTTPEGWNVIWGSVVAGCATLCAVFSLRPRFEVLERWAALPLVALLISYCIWAWVLVAGGGEEGVKRGAFAIVLTIMSFIPTVRLAYMLTRVGRAPRLFRRGRIRDEAVATRAGLGLLLIMVLSGAQPSPVAGTPTAGLDLTWIPGALALLGVIIMAISGRLSNRSDRAGRRGDMTPPSWTDVYERLDNQDRAIRGYGVLTASIIKQWPEGVPLPRLGAGAARAVAALDELDETLVPDEVRALVHPPSRRRPATA